MATQWRPLRPFDPEDAQLMESQADRVVLMEEIQPFLIEIGSNWQFELYISLLSLLGVAPQDRSFSAVTTIYDDTFAGDVLGMCEAFLDYNKPLHADLKLLKKTLVDKLVISNTTLADPTKVEWIRRLFQQGYHQFTDPTSRTLCLLWALEFETKLGLHINSLESATTFAKELLALDPSLQLYERYAYMELNFGNAKMAQRICDKTILSLASSLDKHRFLYYRLKLEDDPWRSLYILYQAYYPKADSLHKAEKRLKKQKLSMKHILSPQMQRELSENLANDVDTALVQVRQSGTASRLEVPVIAICLYHQLYVHCIINGKSNILPSLKEGLSKLESLTAISPRKNALERVHPGQIIREWFIVSALDFLANSNPSPKEWREATLIAISTIPSQPVFAQLFVAAYKNNTMSQQVQRFVQYSIRSSMNKFDSPAPLIWQIALLKELYRVEKAGVENCCARHAWGSVAIRRIRQLFEDALSHTSWRSEGFVALTILYLAESVNAALWRLYLRFELKVGQVDRAIKVLYRSIHKCPWSKALYLDSIKVLRPYVDIDTIQEILSWLVAKDIYIRYES
ncbi:hypothetical protein THRCLA_22439 [Thraustotheca clavata]|uniref:Uncharacterized protein n=1 Tax=Thraustotheca clavata TaxID=74557 RepID=A0A1V9Z1C4_9STRA|nr:hypothetical protein THRCLA_22439 [Thraustotheca clavata]